MSNRPSDPSRWTPSNPPHPRQAPIEPDPTGVREILASLREPGPMPPELIRRITASLSAEQASREQLSSTGHSQDPRHDLHLGRPAAPRTGSGRVYSFTAAQERRESARRRWPLIAAAASVVVLAGALVMGILGALNGGSITTASHDSTSLTSADGGGESGMSAESEPDAGASGAQDSGDDEGNDEASDPADAQGDAATMAAPAVPILSTGAVLTRASLADHVRTVLDGADWRPNAASEQLAADSPLSSVDAAADCLSHALTGSSADLAQRIDAIDLVRYDGEPAGLILVQDQPGGSSWPLTAYLVPADCGRSAPRLLDDPLPLAS